LVVWLFGWLVGSFVGKYVGCLVGWLVGWLSGWLERKESAWWDSEVTVLGLHMKYEDACWSCVKDDD
jgi:NhaP-type Na+/H+ or K+/H+ antiporter